MHRFSDRITSGHCLSLISGLLVAAAVPAGHAVPPPSCGAPDGGSCFVSHNLPGCADSSCCDTVCSADAFCCSVSWDGLCAGQASSMCPMEAYTEPVINPRTGHRHRLLTPQQWEESLLFAVLHGELLATVEDGYENTWLRDTFLVNLDGFPRSAWIGLTDAGSEGFFFWTSGAPLDYVNWLPGEPNDLNGEDFVHMLEGTGRWNDLGSSAFQWGLTERRDIACGPGTGSCFTTHGPGCDVESCCHVVCEADSFCCQSAWDSLCVDEADAWCDPGFVSGPVYNPGTGHRYYLLDFTSWSEAEKTALELMGNLATIDSPAENEWVRRNLLTPDGNDRSGFIGLHDQALEGLYAWTSLASPSYFNWAVGEPSASTGEDHAIMLSNGAWRDEANTALGHFAIIEVPCLGDVDSSGIVDGEDLGAVLAAWSTTAPHADLDGDGVVDGADLGMVLASWGICGVSTCCSPSGGAGCDQPGCQSCVCEIDGFCCSVQWDQICADEAGNECYAACQCLVIE